VKKPSILDSLTEKERAVAEKLLDGFYMTELEVVNLFHLAKFNPNLLPQAILMFNPREKVQDMIAEKEREAKQKKKPPLARKGLRR
jgi:hypothetical protein